MVSHRDEALLRVQQLDAQVAGLRARLEALQLEAEATRQSSQAHLKAVEDRAHAEVDRARQELRQLKQQSQANEKATLARVQQLESELGRARTETAQFQQLLAAEHGRREALEQQASAMHARVDQLLIKAGRERAKPTATRSRTRRKPS